MAYAYGFIEDNMRKILVCVLLVAGVFAFEGCRHVDHKNNTPDKGPIYMRPVHHSKDTAQA